MNPESKPPVTLEDLLRLKRTERPRPEFWDRFDRELRTKQLAALVNKQPWWSRIPRSVLGLTRYRLPIGATAILALTLVTVREYRSAKAPEMLTAESVARGNGPMGAASAFNIEASAPMLAEAGVLPVYEVRGPETSSLAEERAEPTAVTGLSHTISLLGGISERRTSDLIAASLAATQAAAPLVVRSLLGASQGFETRALPARPQAVEPLAQMSLPDEARRGARLQAAVAMMSSSGFPARTGGQGFNRQISDERLYDQVHRTESLGDRFSIKF